MCNASRRKAIRRNFGERYVVCVDAVRTVIQSSIDVSTFSIGLRGLAPNPSPTNIDIRPETKKKKVNKGFARIAVRNYC